MEGTPAVNKKTWKVGTAKGSKKHRKSLEEERSESGDGTKENTLSSVSSDEANEEMEESEQVRQPSRDKLIPIIDKNRISSSSNQTRRIPPKPPPSLNESSSFKDSQQPDKPAKITGLKQIMIGPDIAPSQEMNTQKPWQTHQTKSTVPMEVLD